MSFRADDAPTLGYSPYQRAAQEEYGSQEAWAEAVVKRLRGWGFNTLGSWSSPSTFDHNMPYTVNLNLATRAGADWLKGAVGDFFSRDFQEKMDAACRQLCEPCAKDPWLLGYFTDNELRWGADWRGKEGLLEEYLRFPEGAAGRKAALEFLAQRYKDIASLNQAWGTSITRWEDLSGREPADTEAARTDQAAWQEVVARRYFATCRTAIRKADPNHLILGCRFAGQAPDPVLRGLSDSVDVVSFNNYGQTAPVETLQRIHAVTGRPIMLTEFSFKAMDSGLPNTKGAGRAVATQQDRADGFTGYVHGLIDLPFMVGFHWFEHADEPKEGRFDGENSNYGLVTIDDRPWDILVQSMTRVNAGLEARHLQAAGPSREASEGADEAYASIRHLIKAVDLNPVGPTNWPQFRGPRAGVVEDGVLPSAWSTTEHVAWAAEIPGRGWSSPIVWGDRVFVTTAVAEGDVEMPKKGLYLGGNRDTPSDKAHLWKVYCIDFNSGNILWETTAHKDRPAYALHIKNSPASETPVTDGERVYAYFGNVGLFCYDFNGNLLWSKKWDPVKTRYSWGTAASPVLYKDRLYIINDNDQQSFLAALDAKTGEQLWRLDRNEKTNWATPCIWENDQRTELVTSGTGKVRSYDLSGKLLWELAGATSIAIPTPFAADGLLYVTGGYVGDSLRPLYAIRPGAQGDITLKEGQDSNEFIAWRQRKAGPYNPTPIAYRGYVYVLYDRGLLSCFEARTGKEVYAGVRLAAGANAFTASPWANNGKLFCLSEDGDTFVVQAGPEFALLGCNKLQGMCMATPAAVRGSLLIRTLSKLYRIQE